MTSVLPYDPHPYLHEGMQVEVVRGPLQGVHGILLRKEKRHRLVWEYTHSAGCAVEMDVNMWCRRNGNEVRWGNPCVM